MREETIYTRAKWWRLTRETEKLRMKSDTIQAETYARLRDAGCKAGGVDCQKHTNWVWKRQKAQKQSIRKSPFICKFTSTAIGIGIGRLITEETKRECAVNGKRKEKWRECSRDNSSCEVKVQLTYDTGRKNSWTIPTSDVRTDGQIGQFICYLNINGYSNFSERNSRVLWFTLPPRHS